MVTRYMVVSKRSVQYGNNPLKRNSSKMRTARPGRKMDLGSRGRRNKLAVPLPDVGWMRYAPVCKDESSQLLVSMTAYFPDVCVGGNQRQHDHHPVINNPVVTHAFYFPFLLKRMVAGCCRESTCRCSRTVDCSSQGRIDNAHFIVNLLTA